MSIVEVAAVVLVALGVQYLFLRARGMQKSARGLREGGRKSIQGGRKQVRDSRRLMWQSLGLMALFVIALLGLVIALFLRLSWF
jgi:hypothetical protein